MNYLRLTPQRKPTIRGLAAARQKKGGDIAPLRGAKKRFCGTAARKMTTTTSQPNRETEY